MPDPPVARTIPQQLRGGDDRREILYLEGIDPDQIEFKLNGPGAGIVRDTDKFTRPINTLFARHAVYSDRFTIGAPGVADNILVYIALQSIRYNSPAFV